MTLDFDNDYFMHVSWAADMLGGQMPVRDFVEPGFILQTFVTYVGFRTFGYQLAFEALFAAAAIAAAAVLVFLTCRRSGIPRWLALVAAAFAVACYPRLYAYPKVLVYPAALWAMSVYFDRPSKRSLLTLALVTAVAFLFRHDHGAWIAIAATAGLLLFHWPNVRGACGSAAAYGMAAVLIVAPWLAWVAVSGQASQYIDFLTQRSTGLVTNRIVPDRRFEIDPSQPLVTLAPIDFPRVRIRWSPDATSEARRDRERRYGMDPLPVATDEYRLRDVASNNVRALISDAAVEDTSGIDRSSGRAPGGLFPWLYLKVQQYIPLVRVRILPGAIRPANAEAWTTYLTFILPGLVIGAAAAAAVLSRRRRGSPETGAARPVFAPVIVPAALLSIITYQSLVRGSPDSRLGDVAPITALLLAWISWSAWNVRRPLRVVLRPVVVLVLAITVGAAASYGEVVRRIQDAGIDGPTNFARRTAGVGALYARRPLDVFAPPGVNGLPALARWLHACTTGHDRVSVVGFEPQIFVVAERGFAGGMAFYDLAWASSEHDQRLAIERWSRQDVPVVLAMDSEWPAFASDYPLLRRWIEERYEPVHRSTFGGGKALTVWTERSRPWLGVHQATGLPCFRSPVKLRLKPPRY